VVQKAANDILWLPIGDKPQKLLAGKTRKKKKTALARGLDEFGN
jgi:hypothetical protein